MRLSVRFSIAALLYLIAANECHATEQLDEPPAVLLIATGGTISNHPNGRLTADELIALVPSLSRFISVETEQFTNIPSSAIGLDHWLELSNRLNTILDERPDLNGIVVTTGTDTLEETAYFLNLTVKSDRPIVMVGAMRTPDEVGYDGSANLLDGFKVAAAAASRGRGVLVVLNEQIHGARNVAKRHAQRLDAFNSGLYGPMGSVESDRIVYHRRPMRRHTRRTEFDPATIGHLPRVDIVMSYLGATGDIISAAHQTGAKGLIIAAAGAGATSPGQSDALQKVIDADLTVVITTRTGAGQIPPRRSINTSSENRLNWRYANNRIAGGDLSPIKARVLLMLALSQTSDTTEIQRMFRVY
tara:strand:+ start:398 stop:1474 length:1077 start_codon:yes stop_codon:yes gene_type:complete